MVVITRCVRSVLYNKITFLGLLRQRTFAFSAMKRTKESVPREMEEVQRHMEEIRKLMAAVAAKVSGAEKDVRLASRPDFPLTDGRDVHSH